MNHNKKGLEFSFTWLFSLLAGAFIIFLAIYIGGRFVQTTRYEVTTTTAKELSILFEPMETGLAAGRATQATLGEDTRIYDECYDDGVFGKQQISLSVKRGREWSQPSGAISIGNKYIFTEEVVDGRKIYFFSMPFDFPYKVSDLIVLTTKSYCFANAPESVRSDLGNLNLANIKFESANCTKEDIKVCFAFGTSCDMTVYGIGQGFDTGYVRKRNENLYFTGNLLYPAIFADKSIYECNVKRLMKKTGQLALVYRDQAQLLSTKCGVVSSASLSSFASQVSGIENSQEIVTLQMIAENLDNENSAKECEIW